MDPTNNRQHATQEADKRPSFFKVRQIKLFLLDCCVVKSQQKHFLRPHHLIGEADWKLYPGTWDCLNHGTTPGQPANHGLSLPFTSYKSQHSQIIRESAWFYDSMALSSSLSVPRTLHRRSIRCPYSSHRRQIGRDKTQARSNIAVVAYTQLFYFPSMCSDCQVCCLMKRTTLYI